MTDTPVIDCFAFARRGLQLAGVRPPAEFPRLADLLASADGEVRWQVLGLEIDRPGSDPDPLFRLEFSARLGLPCGRCLKPASVVIHSERDYLLVRDEAEAVRRDDLESECDVVVGDRHFRLLEWIEDEVILALPPVTYHDLCEPDAEIVRQLDTHREGDDAPSSTTQRPFANIAKLRDLSGK